MSLPPTSRFLRARRSACVVIVALLAMVVSVTCGRAGVLCVGADGHVAVEAAAALCCDDAPATENGCADARGCGPCVDLSLAVDGELRAADRAGPDVAAPAPAAGPSPAWTLAGVGSGGAATAPRSDAAVGRALLRTVVLRL